MASRGLQERGGDLRSPGLLDFCLSSGPHLGGTLVHHSPSSRHRDPEKIMCRVLAPALLLILAGGLPPRPRSRPEPFCRIGAGAGKMEFTCGECQIEAQNGLSGFIAVARPIGRGFTAGLEATFANAAFDTVEGEDHAWLWGAMAAAGLRGGPGLPVWGTLGLGWVLYSGVGPNSSGPALSLSAGGDLAIGALGFVSPYAEYVTMLGHDGPEVAGPSDALPHFAPVDRPPFSLESRGRPRL
jgi:hypothetical protein